MWLPRIFKQSAAGLSIGVTRHIPPEMIDESVGILQHTFKENEDLLFLKRTEGGYSSLIKGLVYETSVLSKSWSAADVTMNELWSERVELTISCEWMPFSSPCYKTVLLRRNREKKYTTHSSASSTKRGRSEYIALLLSSKSREACKLFKITTG